MHEISVRTSQETLLHYRDQPVNAVRETVTVCCENHTEHTNTHCGQNAEFWCIKSGGACRTTGL
jgi:hypothetical protein